MNEIKNIKITDLVSAPDNPFKVTLDTEMERLIESIAETGVIAPIIARPTDREGGSLNFAIRFWNCLKALQNCKVSL